LRVAVFGAAGNLGRRVLELLLKGKGIDFLLAADHDTRGLSDLHSTLGHLGVTVRYLEAEDRRSYGERMSSCEAVISCLGGSGIDEFPLALEAVERGCLYLSSNGDPTVFLRREEAGNGGPEGRGTAVMGLGWSPGLSGLLAVRLGSRFQRLDALRFSWLADAREMVGPGGLEELMLLFGGRCLSFEEGRRRAVRAGSWEELVRFPPRSAVAGVTYVRAPEPLTLPSRFPEVLRVQVKGGLTPGHLQLPVHTLSWAWSLHDGALRDLILHAAGLIIRRGSGPGRDETEGALLVEAKGIREGRPGQETIGATGSRLGVTAGLLVGVLERLLEKKTPRGVLAPEEALELAEVLPALRRSGTRFWSESVKI